MPTCSYVDSNGDKYFIDRKKDSTFVALVPCAAPFCAWDICMLGKKGLDRMGRKRELTPYGKEIKHKLIELNKTQVELAEEIGTSKQYLGKILFGERSGTMYLEKIAQVLHLD